MVDLIPGLPNDLAMECLFRLHFKTITNAVLTCKNWKQAIGSREYLRRRFIGGHSQSIVVLMLPNYNFVVSELKTGIRSALPPIPGFTGVLWSFCHPILVAHNLVAICWRTNESSSALREVYVYSFFSNTWRRGADLPTALIWFKCVSDSDRVVYVFDGRVSVARNERPCLLAYDLVKDKWIQLPDVVICNVFAAVFLSGKLLVFGSQPHYWSKSKVVNVDIQAYDPSTGSWDPPISGGRYVLDNDNLTGGISAGHDGKLYKCRQNDLCVLENGKCIKFADYPVRFSCTYGLTTWNKHEHLAFVGYSEFTRHLVCVLDLKSKEWSIVQSPRGLVTSVFCLEI